ncbi:MAG: flagellar motor protein MotB [Gemmatimonadales bacterium]
MDLRLGKDDSQGTPWSVLADLTITMVLVLVVYMVLMFLQTFRERAINAELAKQQHAVRAHLMDSTAGRWQIRVDSLTPDRQRITFSSEVLFDPCRAILKPEGLALLRTVGLVLQQEAPAFEAVQVEGHTDRRPIPAQGVDCPFPSNWELSSARATRVVTLLANERYLADTLLSAVGRAEFQPVDTTALDPNRRIELILLYSRTRVADQVLNQPRDPVRP